MAQAGKGVSITIISKGPGVDTVVQKIRIDTPFRLPKPIPATPKPKP